MSILRQIVLPLYRWATAAHRARAVRRFDETQQWPAAILYYHRVANSIPNPWSIRCDRFSEQLDFIDSIADFASLDELRQDQMSQSRDRLKVAITFDDGYGENMEWAIPELVARKIPCTYFVCTDFIENSLPFNHDVQRGFPLRPNTKSEICSMASEGIQIGGHTRSHLDLGQNWPVQKLRSEISDSRKKLQDWTGQSIDYFAFPFGLTKNISQAAIDIVVESGFKAFLSAFNAWNFPKGDELHLSRFHGDPCTETLRNWLTFDPRRLKPIYTLRYQKPTISVAAKEKAPSPWTVIPPTICDPCPTTSAHWVR